MARRLCICNTQGNVRVIRGGSEVLVIQKVTGTLSPGAHAGSYNGQDAYNDMLVIDDGLFDKQSQLPHNGNTRTGGDVGCDRLQRSADTNRGGGYDMETTVRRLTPLECTRLQGFPDGWVDIGDWTDEKGKIHKESDSAKYKALGNSVAMPFWEYLARRICAQYERPVTMGSLFDGIGGFPLAFEKCGGKAVWASEVEDFCIAVTKKRFGDE